jgi:hypothetical protein
MHVSSPACLNESLGDFALIVITADEKRISSTSYLDPAISGLMLADTSSHIGQSGLLS